MFWFRAPATTAEFEQSGQTVNLIFGYDLLHRDIDGIAQIIIRNTHYFDSIALYRLVDYADNIEGIFSVKYDVPVNREDRGVRFVYQNIEFIIFTFSIEDGWTIVAQRIN